MQVGSLHTVDCVILHAIISTHIRILVISVFVQVTCRGCPRSRISTLMMVRPTFCCQLWEVCCQSGSLIVAVLQVCIECVPLMLFRTLSTHAACVKILGWPGSMVFYVSTHEHSQLGTVAVASL